MNNCVFCLELNVSHWKLSTISYVSFGQVGSVYSEKKTAVHLNNSRLRNTPTQLSISALFLHNDQKVQSIGIKKMSLKILLLLWTMKQKLQFAGEEEKTNLISPDFPCSRAMEVMYPANQINVTLLRLCKVWVVSLFLFREQSMHV